MILGLFYLLALFGLMVLTLVLTVLVTLLFALMEALQGLPRRLGISPQSNETYFVMSGPQAFDDAAVAATTFSFLTYIWFITNLT